MGKILAIYTDCCYSGQWVVDCAKCLDEMGIGACGHQTMQKGIFIRVIASCEPNQKATIEHFVVQKGIKFNDHYKTLFFYHSKKLSGSQTTYTCDFTKVKCLQWEGPTAPCLIPDILPRCSWKWEDVVAINHKNRPIFRLYLVRGKNNGRDVWHCVLVDKERIDTFHTSCTEENVSQYGHIIKSGWGRNPPSNIVEGFQKYGPTC